MMQRHHTVRRNPRARPAPKHPMVVLVRRFDPSGEELSRWEVLVRDVDGAIAFLSRPKAKAAALHPPQDADLHVGDLIVTVLAEAAAFPEEHATELYVVAPDGVKAAPEPPKELAEGWLVTWGQDAGEMLRASAAVDRRRVVMAGCDCAETVLHIIPAADLRPREAIETARAWCRGDATLDSVYSDEQAAAAAANEAGRRKRDDIRTAANAAWAAAHNASGGSSSYDGPVHFAAHAAYEHNGANHEATLHALAPLVERWIPLPVVLLSTLGYPDAIPFDLSAVPTASTTPRENPRSRSRRRRRR